MAVAPSLQFLRIFWKRKKYFCKKNTPHVLTHYKVSLDEIWGRYFSIMCRDFSISRGLQKNSVLRRHRELGTPGPFYFLHHDKKNSDILSFLVGKHFAIHSMIKREVKMAGLCLTSFFAFLWTATKSRSVKSQKKQDQSPAILTEQTW